MNDTHDSAIDAVNGSVDNLIEVLGEKLELPSGRRRSATAGP